MIKILHIIPVWSLSTGPSQILFHLLKNNNLQNFQHCIAIFNQDGSIPPELKKYSVYAFPTLILHRWKWSPRFKFFLETHYPQFDILHLHGCWIYPNYAVYRLSKKLSIPFIFRPAGALLNQAINSKRKWIKKIYFHLIEKKILSQAIRIHALSDLELNELRKLAINCPVVLSQPNIPKPFFSFLKLDSIVPKDILDKKIILSICSFSPIKNLEFLSKVLLQVKLVFPDFCWIIGGPWDDTPFGKKIKRKITKDLGENVWFASEVNHSEKYTLLNASSIYLSASKSENFGLSILEALMSNTIVIAGENQPWSKEIKANFGFSIPLCPLKYYDAILFTLQSTKPKPVYKSLPVTYSWERMYKDSIPF